MRTITAVRRPQQPGVREKNRPIHVLHNQSLKAGPVRPASQTPSKLLCFMRYERLDLSLSEQSLTASPRFGH